MAPAPQPEEHVRRLDTSIFRPKDVVLTVPAASITPRPDDFDPDDSEQVVEFTIRGDLPLEQTVLLFDLDSRVHELADGDHSGLLTLCQEAKELILELIRERHEVEDVAFSPEEVLGVLAFISEGKSPTQNVADALTGSGNRRERRAAERRPPQRPARPAKKRPAAKKKR